MFGVSAATAGVTVGAAGGLIGLQRPVWRSRPARPEAGALPQFEVRLRFKVFNSTVPGDNVFGMSADIFRMPG